MFLKEIMFSDWSEVAHQYPFYLSAFQGLSRLSFAGPVTFFVGENGSGKSTLLEAIAKGAGFNPEGGGRNNVFSNARTESTLDEYLRLSWLPKVTKGFFLRAESFFNFASYVDEIAREDARIYQAYGGKSLHEQSHGESFLSLFTNSPILLGYPKAQVYNFNTTPLSPIRYEETDHYIITKQFLANKEGMLKELFHDS